MAIEQLETIESLYQRIAELEARNAELDAFAHTASHALKNLLGVVGAYAGMLGSGELDEEQYQMAANAIIRVAGKAAKVVDDLLLLANVKGSKEIPIALLNMQTIVDEALVRLDPLKQEMRAEIAFPQSWPVAWGYAPWVEEVWVNYLSNAIKYGGCPPHIEIGTDRVASSTIPETKAVDERRVRFWVRDNGPGLTPVEQARLFIEFDRLGKMRGEGQGLGLSIVRRIVERLGGEVGVESQVGEGSLFYFTLPEVR